MRELALGDVRLNPEDAMLSCTNNGKSVRLAAKEYQLMELFLRNPHQLLPKENILERVWGFDFFGDSRTVDVHIKRLREKLPECEKYGWEIHTVWRVGYKFEYKAS